LGGVGWAWASYGGTGPASEKLGLGGRYLKRTPMKGGDTKEMNMRSRIADSGFVGIRGNRTVEGASRWRFPKTAFSLDRCDSGGGQNWGTALYGGHRMLW